MLRSDQPLGMLPHNHSSQIERLESQLVEMKKGAEVARIKLAKGKELERIERQKEIESERWFTVKIVILGAFISALVSIMFNYFFK